METRYTEIYRLKDMLERAHIPFDFDAYTSHIHFEHHQICYPVFQPNHRVCSVVEGRGTYGAQDNLLEIQGLLTPEEDAYDSVAGWLKAEEVFRRIKEHWEETNREKTNL